MELQFCTVDFTKVLWNLEIDWLRFLLSGFEVKFITDQTYQVVTDRAIIITTGEAIAGISIQQYL
ncbi:hypothetical protein ACQ4M4_02975 [Leptolyngbya sp. AN02str]|uniref:hypothetical protein n=1 Tax=Leptolyngbya sp. AN02str TaxID=3423363 RepID=UPI003D310D31